MATSSDRVFKEFARLIASKRRSLNLDDSPMRSLNEFINKNGTNEYVKKYQEWRDYYDKIPKDEVNEDYKDYVFDLLDKLEENIIKIAQGEKIDLFEGITSKEKKDTRESIKSDDPLGVLAAKGAETESPFVKKDNRIKVDSDPLRPPTVSKDVVEESSPAMVDNKHVRETSTTPIATSLSGQEVVAIRDLLRLIQEVEKYRKKAPLSNADSQLLVKAENDLAKFSSEHESIPLIKKYRDLHYVNLTGREMKSRLELPLELQALTRRNLKEHIESMIKLVESRADVIKSIDDIKAKEKADRLVSVKKDAISLAAAVASATAARTSDAAVQPPSPKETESEEVAKTGDVAGKGVAPAPTPVTPAPRGGFFSGLRALFGLTRARAIVPPKEEKKKAAASVPTLPVALEFMELIKKLKDSEDSLMKGLNVSAKETLEAFASSEYVRENPNNEYVQAFVQLNDRFLKLYDARMRLNEEASLEEGKQKQDIKAQIENVDEEMKHILYEREGLIKQVLGMFEEFSKTTAKVASAGAMPPTGVAPAVPEGERAKALENLKLLRKTAELINKVNASLNDPDFDENKNALDKFVKDNKEKHPLIAEYARLQEVEYGGDAMLAFEEKIIAAAGLVTEAEKLASKTETATPPEITETVTTAASASAKTGAKAPEIVARPSDWEGKIKALQGAKKKEEQAAENLASHYKSDKKSADYNAKLQKLQEEFSGAEKTYNQILSEMGKGWGRAGLSQRLSEIQSKAAGGAKSGLDMSSKTENSNLAGDLKARRDELERQLSFNSFDVEEQRKIEELRRALSQISKYTQDEGSKFFDDNNIEKTQKIIESIEIQLKAIQRKGEEKEANKRGFEESFLRYYAGREKKETQKIYSACASVDNYNKNVEETLKEIKKHMKSVWFARKEDRLEYKKLYEDIKYKHDKTKGELTVQTPSGSIVQKYNREKTKREVETTISKNSSDDTIFRAIDLNRRFVPLTLDVPCDSELAVKLYEAALLRGIKVEIKKELRDQLTADDSPVKAFFEEIESLKDEPEEIRKKANEKGKLGPPGEQMGASIKMSTEEDDKHKKGLNS